MLSITMMELLLLLIRRGEVLTPFGLGLLKPIHLSPDSRRTDFKHNLAGSIIPGLPFANGSRVEHSALDGLTLHLAASPRLPT